MKRCFLLIAVISLVPVIDGRFSISRQYRTEREKGPFVITFDESQNMATPKEIWEEAQSVHGRQARQTSGQQDPSTTSFLLRADNQRYAIVHWDGLPETTVFVLTVDHPLGNNTRNARVNNCQLWRSTDYGVTFADETSKWPDDAGVNWYYISQHNDSYIIFADIMNNRLYVTEDEGETYRTVHIPVTPFVVKFVPGYATWLGPGWSQNCFVHDFLNRTILVSGDLFRTFTEFDEDVTEAFWGTLEIDEPGTIFFDSLESNRKVLKRAVPPYDKPHVKDHFNQYFDAFWLSYNYIFVVDEDHDPNVVYVSYNRTDFKQAQLPNNAVGKHYSLVDASENQVFMAIYHDVNNTALYISEEQGVVYTLSLEHLISSSESSWESGDPVFDVYLVDGLKGVLFANQKNPRSSFGASVVSYDKGGRWDAITPPAVDHNNNIINCSPPSCSLHLHMDTSADKGYNGILSRDSAKGLLLAQGNTGSTLNRFSSQMKLYMSTNGGYTWVEIDQPYAVTVYQFLDFGSVLTYCRRWVSTSAFKYSCDEGLSWSTVSFPNSLSVRVAGMLTEFGEKALHATIFGYTYSGGRFGGWYIIGLNFTRSMSRRCQPEDYSLWSPTDEHLDRECLLGEHEEYERRNSTNCCYNGLDYERPTNTYKCNCTIEDYECDYGFQRESINDPCVLIPGINPYLPPDSCVEGDTYKIGSGYRKVSGDVCIEDPGSFLSSRTVPCPVKPPGELTVVSTSADVGIGKTAGFILVQESGGKLLTNYTWDFGDNTSTLLVGYKQSKSVSHVYTSPGTYKVSVTAMNAEGRSIGEETVLVLDQVQSVTIIGSKIVVADTPVLYRVEVTTVNSLPYRPARFSWLVDYRVVETTDEPSLLHVFPFGGHIITCTVSNPNGAILSDGFSLTAEPGGRGLNATIQSSKPVAGVQEELTFTISLDNVTVQGVLSVHVAFSDKTSSYDRNVSVSSSSQTLVVHHTFTQPGVFSVYVSVTSSSQSVAASTSTTVSVREKYGGISMYRPGFVGNQGIQEWTDLLNVTILFEFRLYQDDAKIHPVESPDFESTKIMVDYGDGGPQLRLYSSLFYHTYSRTGSYTFSLSATNGVSTVEFNGVVHITSLPTNVILIGPNIVQVNIPSVFTVSTNSSSTAGQNLLDSLLYNWRVYKRNDKTDPIFTTTASHRQFSYFFSSSDTFVLVVNGYHSQHASGGDLIVSGQKSIIVRDPIFGMTVDVKPAVVLVGEDVSVVIHLYKDAAKKTAYNDAVDIDITVFSLTSENTKEEKKSLSGFSVLTETFQLSEISSYNITVAVDNIISRKSTMAVANAVEAVDIVEFVFTIPNNGLKRKSVWLAQFAESVRQQLIKTYKLADWSLRVMAKLLESDDTNDKIAAYVSVLPQTSADDQIENARKVVEMVRSVPNAHVGFTFPEVSGTFVPVLYSPPAVQQLSGPSSGVIAAIVVCATLLLVAVVTVMSIVIYVLYRKYHRLEVRYSRLTQRAHVRFEAVEDDEDDMSGSPEPTTDSN